MTESVPYGADAIRAAVEAAGPPDGLPVTPLGEDPAGGYWLLSKSGALRKLTEGQLGQRSYIAALFGGVQDWLAENCPANAQQKKNGVKWDTELVRDLLIQRCTAEGFFDVDRMVRGHGAWRDDDGGLILHCGRQILIGGAYVDAGRRIGKYVYPRAPEMTRPGAQAATGADAAALMHFIDTWNWRRPDQAARLLVGWIAGAMICGALDWRPHVWVTGDKGSGKTTLEKAIFGLLGPVLLRAADPSAAGIRNALAGAARPVALDEVEYDPQNPRARACLELARLASSENQGAVLRGAAGRAHYSYFMRAAFYFTSIIHAPMRGQDRSRVTVLELDPLEAMPPEWRLSPADVVARTRDYAEMAPLFLARIVQGWDRLQQNMVVYDGAIGALKGFRVADQFGTLLALAETMLSDDVATAESVAAVIDGFDFDHFTDADGTGEGHDCLTYLTTSRSGFHSAGREYSIGEVALLAAESPAQDYGDHLNAIGLKIKFGRIDNRDYPLWLCVANRHTRLREIFAGTPWAEGGWRQALQHIPLAESSGTERFRGQTPTKAVLVPLELLGDLKEPPQQGEDIED